MSSSAEHASCAASSAWWRLPLLLAIVLAVIVLTVGRGGLERSVKPEPVASENNAATTTAEKVQLTIDFGDLRPRQNAAVNWHEGMTVADLLRREPSLHFKSIGDGASTFLTELNGVENEGAGGGNWTYSVNGERADRSYAVYELHPNDRVLWTFAAPQ
jgi:Domain of unknown function (DUF4430)